MMPRNHALVIHKYFIHKYTTGIYLLPSVVTTGRTLERGWMTSAGSYFISSVCTKHKAEPVSTGDLGTSGLSRGHLRGQSDTHMLCADISHCVFLLRHHSNRCSELRRSELSQTVWPVRHYPNCAAWCQYCQMLLVSKASIIILFGDSSEHSHGCILAMWHKNYHCINHLAQKGYLLHEEVLQKNNYVM